jgi:hypothetical protein
MREGGGRNEEGEMHVRRLFIFEVQRRVLKV